MKGIAVRDSGQATEGSDGTYNVDLIVHFSVPKTPSVSAPGVPLLSLAAETENSGGTLKGGKNYYYAVSGNGSEGEEGALSFLVRASVPSGTDTNRVTLSGLSFPANTASFNVYRGSTPAHVLRIAEGQAHAESFVDDGRVADLAKSARQELRSRQFLLADGASSRDRSNGAFAINSRKRHPGHESQRISGKNRPD